MRHLVKFTELVFAVILSSVLFPLALIFNITQLQKGSILKDVWYVSVEILKIVFDLFEKIAIIIDRLGNLILGDVFTLLYVKKEFKDHTLFGKSEITISASFGHCLQKFYLKKSGINFTKFLDWIFGKAHCSLAYEWYLIKKNFNQNNKTGIS